MTNQSTLDKLIEICLTAMADVFRNQLDAPELKEILFEDQFGMLVDIEYSSCKNNRLRRLIKNVGFDQPEASIIDINYTSGCRLNKELLHRLATWSIYLNTGTFLLSVLQAVVGLTWSVPLAWRHVRGIITPNMSVSRIC